MRQIEFQCAHCSVIFIDKSSYKSRLSKFCSKKCYALSLRKSRFCPVCNGHVGWQNKIFCSKKCCVKVQKGKSLSIEHTASLSKAKIGKPIKHLLENKEEISKKISKSLRGRSQPWNRGENHPRYIDGGKAAWERQKAMGRVEYKEWRRNVFKKDNFTCIICLKKGCRLNADHIKPWATFPEDRYNVENGRTLCIKCHRETDTFGGKMHRKKIGING